jgi:hypothetical protein
MALRENPEARLQIASANYLRGIIRNGRTVIKVQKPFPELLAMHVSNEASDEKQAFWNGIKGILPGAPDWLLFWSVKEAGAVELKIDTGLSGNQKDFAIKFQDIGFRYAVCKSVASVRDTLISWGLPCKNTQAIEPNPSLKDKMEFMAEMYRND